MWSSNHFPAPSYFYIYIKGSSFLRIQVFQGPGISGSRFLRVQVQGPGFSRYRFFWVQVLQGSGFSKFGSKFRVHVLEVAILERVRKWSTGVLNLTTTPRTKVTPSNKVISQAKSMLPELTRFKVSFPPVSIISCEVQCFCSQCKKLAKRRNEMTAICSNAATVVLGRFFLSFLRNTH